MIDSMLSDLSNWIMGSSAREFAIWALSNIPGFPPLIQTVHLLSITAIVASAVILALRVTGVAVRSQHPREMALRLRYWFVAGLVGTFCSGVFFILARPNRYFYNPVFQIKFAVLVPAIIVSAVIYYLLAKREGSTNGVAIRLLGLVSVILWVTVILAGRWIAYSEYLFWVE
jgi:hypothetical protein